MIKFFVEKIMKARWIVNSSGEMGIRIFGINMWYYKWPEPLVGNSDDNTYWRVADKREFGETIKSEKMGEV
jgi:hypothetical protein